MASGELIIMSEGSQQETTNFISFAAPFAKRPSVEGRKSSWPKSTEIMHLVFHESLNGRHNKYGERLLPENSGDRSLARLDILKIFHSQLVTKRRHRYLRKNKSMAFCCSS